jgi:hypothetical protein
MDRGHGMASALSRRLAAGVLALGLLAAAATAAGRPAGRAQAPPSTGPAVEGWAKDLEFLAAELPRRHKNLFFHLAEPEFRRAVEALKADLPTLDEDETLVRFLQLVASIGDSHTAIGYRPRSGLPLMLYWFRDGIFVLNTTEDHRDLLGGRITALGGRPIEEVTAALASVIPHENEAQVKNQVPNFLIDTAVLHGLKILPSPGSAALTIQTAAGRSLTADLAPIAFSSKPAWAVDTADETGAPLYLGRRGEFYWYEILAPDKALYFKYNACRETPGRPFAAFVGELFAAAEAGAVERIVVDLRHNGGGNSAVFGPFLEELKKRPAFLQKDRLAVIVGRRTFSSAILNALDLRKDTPAVFFGEPTGGKPNHYGELQTLKLPGSGLSVSYSTKYFQVVKGDPDSIVPDVAVDPTYADYRSKTDPVLDAALGRRR